MSDAGRVALYSVEESVWGTTPASAMDTVAYATSIAGGLDRTTAMTNAIRSDYTKPNIIAVQDNGSLSVGHELAYGDVPIASWYEGLFRSDWAGAVTVTGTTISFNSGTSKILDSGNGFTTAWDNRWVKVSGSTYNDGHYFVTAAAAGELTVSATLGDAPLTTESAGATITVKNDGTLLNGTTQKSYTVERYFSDQSVAPFVAQTGLRVSGATLEIAKAIVTGSVNFVGKKPNAAAAATAGTGSANAAVTTRILNGAVDISAILEGGTAITAKASQISLSFDGGQEATHALGTLDPFGVSGNSFSWSGSLNVYANDAGLALWNKFRGDTATSIYFRLTDTAGNVLQWSLPAVRYTGGNPDVTGVDTRNYINLAFGVERDSTIGGLGQIDRFAA